jgi:hypothetical protein
MNADMPGWLDKAFDLRSARFDFRFGARVLEGGFGDVIENEGDRGLRFLD